LNGRLRFLPFAVMMVALFWSSAPALLSIATAVMGVLALYLLISRPKTTLGSFGHVVAIVWVVFLGLSIFYTEAPTAEYFKELSFKLTFLGLFIAGSRVKLSARAIQVLIMLFSYLAMVVALGTFINYLVHYDQINELISQSKPIPIISGQNHISYSYMLGFAILASVYLLVKRREGGNTIPYWVIALPLTINFLMIHIIAARTGLVATYMAIGMAGLAYFMIEKKKVILGISLVLFLAISSVLALKFVKPLNQRLQNTITDYSVYFNDGNPNWWSGTMRLEAMENAWYVYKDNIWIGVGMADLSQAVDDMYAERGTLLLPENRINPHNQFMNMMIVGGSIGVLLLLLFFGWLGGQSFKHGNWLLLAFVVLSFVGFNLEAFMERQIGSCFFGLTSGLLLQPYFYRK